jgi:hypothetical protein
MDTPAERLIGHWSTESGDNLYYAKPKDEGLGSHVLVQPNGNTARHHYKVLSQIPTGERVVVDIVFSDGSKRTETYMISKDGKELVSTIKILGSDLSIELRYVDNKTEP